jgi:hypothetical protein
VTTVTAAVPEVPAKLKRSYRIAADGRGWEHLCSACQVWLPADSKTFQSTRSISTGLSSICLRCARDRKAEWQRTHPAQSYAQHTRHRARHAGHLTATQWQDMLTRYGHTCLACGEHESYTGTLAQARIDHALPGTVANTQPLCGPCNSRQGTKTVDYRPLFLSRMGRAA